MNPQTKQEALDLAQGIADSVDSKSPGDVGLFVPFPYIESVKNVVGDKAIIGAQVSFMVGLGCLAEGQQILAGPGTRFFWENEESS